MKPHIKQFFKFLEKKEGREIPLKVKLLNPKDFKIGPEDLNVKGDLVFSQLPLQSLPDNLTVRGDLYLNNTQIQSLPDNLTVGRDLYLLKTEIESLPDNLTVKRDLDLAKIPIKSLPNNLKVGGYLDLENTPLAKKYTKEQIRSMIEERGGYVKKFIYL